MSFIPPPQMFWKRLLAGGAALLVICAQAEQTATIQQSETLLDQIIADSQKHAFKRTTDARHPLRLAESRAAGTAGDLSEYSELMIEIITRWAKIGEFAEAAYLADNLPASGPASAHLEIAWVLLEKGKREKAAEHAGKSLETLEQARGRKAELLRTRYCELLYSLGRESEAKTEELRLSELAKLELEARLQSLQSKPALSLQQAQARMAQCEDRGVDRVRATFLLGCANRQLSDGNQKAGLELLQEVGRLSTRDGLPSAQRMLIELARSAYAGGEFKEADKAIKLFLEIIKTYADAADWKAPYLAEALDVLIDWKGRDKQVNDWLKVGEAGLSKVFVMEAPKSALALARVAQRAAGFVEADRLVMLAAKAGRSHPHPRAQATSAVLVCLFYSDAGRAIPADILKVINPQTEAAIH